MSDKPIVKVNGKSLSGVTSFAIDTGTDSRDMATVRLEQVDTQSIAQIGDSLAIAFVNFLPLFKGEIVGVEPVFSRKGAILRAFSALPRMAIGRAGPVKLPSAKIQNVQTRRAPLDPRSASAVPGKPMDDQRSASVVLGNLTPVELATFGVGLAVDLSVTDLEWSGSIVGVEVAFIGDGNKCTLQLRNSFGPFR